MSYPASWTVTGHTIINGRHVQPGQELTIERNGRKLPGTYRFVQHVTTPDTEWIDVVGGKDATTRYAAQRMTRSFHPSQVRTVHRMK